MVSRFSELETEAQISSHLDNLERVTSRVRVVSAQVGLITLVHLIVPIATMSLAATAGAGFGSPGEFRAVSSLLLLFDIALLFVSITLAWFFDRLARTGNVLFQEISDELERHGSAPISARVVLRRFVLEATLPFLRKADTGTFSYVVVNASLTVFTLLGVYAFRY
jgi:hypothetical protein